MAGLPDAVTQSIENATDDLAFESLCSDILAGSGYPGIEPIGGTGDGGRDALHIDRSTDKTTICAFSLRKDWFKVKKDGEPAGKLISDCARVEELGHACNSIVFATSAQPTPTERDNAVKAVSEKFGWTLELYGRGRLATQLRGRLEHLIEHYPAIFLPSQFRLAGGRLLEMTSRDLLVVDYVDPDRGFAYWITKCLRRFGYDVWCLGLDSVAGESVDDTILTLLRERARHHLPVMNEASVAANGLRGRIEVSASEDRRLLPLRFQTADLATFSDSVQRIGPIDFVQSRAAGMHELTAKLVEWGVPKCIEVSRGRQVPLHLSPPRDLVRHEPETLISNIYPVTRIPTRLHAWRLPEKIKQVQIDNARRVWPFVRAGQMAFSFIEAPVPDELGFEATAHSWKLDWRTARDDSFDGRRPSIVVSELLRRTLDFAFFQAGLLWCPEQKLIYFDAAAHFNEETKAGRKLSAKLPTGDSALRSVCGRGSRFRPGKDVENEAYRWQFAPCYSCNGRVSSDWEFRLWTRLRVSFADGTSIPSNRIVTFRKDAAKGWTQDRFRDLLAIAMNHAAGGGPMVIVGEGTGIVEISTQPVTFVSPIRLAEEAVPKGASKFAGGANAAVADESVAAAQPGDTE